VITNSRCATLCEQSVLVIPYRDFIDVLLVTDGAAIGSSSVLLRRTEIPRCNFNAEGVKYFKMEHRSIAERDFAATIPERDSSEKLYGTLFCVTSVIKS